LPTYQRSHGPRSLRFCVPGRERHLFDDRHNRISSRLALHGHQDGGFEGRKTVALCIAIDAELDELFVRQRNPWASFEAD
jgi:hypothetical protein